jgi:hypothetical protein
MGEATSRRTDRIEARRRIRREPAPWHPATLPPPGLCLEHDGVTFEANPGRPAH